MALVAERVVAGIVAGAIADGFCAWRRICYTVAHLYSVLRRAQQSSQPGPIAWIMNDVVSNLNVVQVEIKLIMNMEENQDKSETCHGPVHIHRCFWLLLMASRASRASLTLGLPWFAESGVETRRDETTPQYRISPGDIGRPHQPRE